MKVLHINYTDEGGAYIALKRIDDAIKTRYPAEIQSAILVINPVKNANTDASGFQRTFLWKFITFIKPRFVRILMQLFSRKGNHATASYNILRARKLINFINNSDFDIIHLHWIGGETLSVSDFKRIKKKIVWTIHDCWAYLGYDHYPSLGMQAQKQNDALSHYLINRKRKHWHNLKMTVVCVSNWLYQEATISNVLAGNFITKISNVINTDFWEPFDAVLSRKLLNLPEGKVYICMGAVNPTSDERKGFALLKDALKLLPDNYKDKISVIMFGTSAATQEVSGVPIQFLGKIEDELVMKLIIDASNIVLVPSYFETFGQTALEAICMQKLVVCFDASGTTDIVDHKQNGYIAKSYESKDFADGIVWAIDNFNDAELKYNCRKKAVNNFGTNIIADAYFEVYQKQLGDIAL